MEYISREKVLEVLEKADRLWAFDSNQDYHEVRGDIKRIPATDVQPVKHGEWESSQPLWKAQTTRCSNCKAEMYVDDLCMVSGDIGMLPAFCPRCGCDMRGDEND